MLGYLRENTGNWVIKIFLGIIVLVFVFLGVGSMNSTRNNSIATVNDEPITITEYQDAHRNMVEGLRRQFGNNLDDDLLKALNVKQQVLNSLIEQKILDMEADRLDIEVSNAELQDVLMGITAFQKDGAFDMETYKKVLGLNSLNPEMFEELQRRQLQHQKLRQLILGSVTVSDIEAENWYQFENTQRVVDYLKVDPNGFDITPSQEQIATHYGDNKTKYKSQALRRAAYLKFSPEDYKDKVVISDENIQNYYDQNLPRFTTPEQVEARHILIRTEENASEDVIEQARKKAWSIYEKAVKGDDFAKLAQSHSEGPSKTNGGYLGKFAQGSMVKPFGDKAFALKAEEISEPVKTQFGWHIIKVEARFDKEIKTLAQVKELIKGELQGQELQNMAYFKAGEAFDAVVDGDDFEQVALIAGKKLTETQAFNKGGEGLKIAGDASGFAVAAFALPNDEISDVKQLGNDYYLIKIIERIAPKVLPLEKVAETVKSELTTIYQKEAAAKKADALLKKVLEAKSLDTVGKSESMAVETTEPFNRKQRVQNIENAQEFVKAAFELTKENPILSKTLESKGGYYIIELKDQMVPKADEIKAQMETIKSQLTRIKQNQYYQTWITDLKKKSTIEVDPNFNN